MYQNDTNTKSAEVCAERQSEVNEQLSRNNVLLDQLEENVHRLGDRISTILANRADPKTACNAAPVPTLVPLASVLRDRNDRLDTLSGIVDDFVRRVEL